MNAAAVTKGVGCAVGDAVGDAVVMMLLRVVVAVASSAPLFWPSTHSSPVWSCRCRPVAPAVGRSRGREVMREGGHEGGRREEGTEMPHLNSDLLGSRLIVDTPSHLDVCLLP